jgi:nicotinate-nucleotide adenylyltransferase
MNTGVLGGTLDPIHYGHLAAADAAQQALSLDRMLLIPSNIAPHRADPAGASPGDRFVMAQLAVEGRPRWAASRLELDRDGPSYTFDTLDALQNQPEGSQFFFIIGTDAFSEIATWSRYPAVLDLANFVVVSRPGFTLDSLQKRLPDLADRMTTPDRFQLSAKTRIVLLEAPTPDISSTDIRRRVRSHESIAGLVPDAVADYIRTHRLYLGQ